MSYTSERWLAIRLDYLAAAMVLAVALLFTGLRDAVNPSIAGLSIIYSLQLMGFLQYTVRLSVMVCVTAHLSICGWSLRALRSRLRGGGVGVW
jgi:hypothetical protein